MVVVFVGLVVVHVVGGVEMVSLGVGGGSVSNRSIRSVLDESLVRI